MFAKIIIISHTREHYMTNGTKKGTSGRFFGMKEGPKLDNISIMSIFGLVI